VSPGIGIDGARIVNEKPIDVAKKADCTAYDVRYTYRNEPLKTLRLE